MIFKIIKLIEPCNQILELLTKKGYGSMGDDLRPYSLGIRGQGKNINLSNDLLTFYRKYSVQFVLLLYQDMVLITLLSAIKQNF